MAVICSSKGAMSLEDPQIPHEVCQGNVISSRTKEGKPLHCTIHHSLRKAEILPVFPNQEPQSPQTLRQNLKALVGEPMVDM